MKGFWSLLTDTAGVIARSAGFVATLGILLVLLHFPYDSDRPIPPAEAAKARTFYAAAYDKDKSTAVSPQEEKYAKLALKAAEEWHVKDQVAAVVRKFGLENKKALDIGSGQGYLQDVMPDYTGLDISATVQRYYHKRFVLGSATAMPFDDDTFDTVWSIWVLEHVPNPEAALVEIRRVAKDGSILFLGPQWDCHTWQADGYDVRPYGDFGLWGKMVKAAIPARVVLARLAMPPVRAVRGATWKLAGGPSTFRYHRLTPNFQTYWEPDSDAVNSLDFYEMGLWFRSRGDDCLSCESGWHWVTQTKNPLIIRIHKTARGLSAHGAGEAGQRAAAMTGQTE
ncbi:MAG TPA: class I SAM-dependent methyltransferase [Bryobacteraceae bacterium]|nr:class I SAM-dependent methyltransferase [Bryobacteraceae bacterium]